LLVVVVAADGKINMVAVNGTAAVVALVDTAQLLGSL
jgi:hypothetical protein